MAKRVVRDADTAHRRFHLDRKRKPTSPKWRCLFRSSSKPVSERLRQGRRTNAPEVDNHDPNWKATARELLARFRQPVCWWRNFLPGPRIHRRYYRHRQRGVSAPASARSCPTKTSSAMAMASENKVQWEDKLAVVDVGAMPGRARGGRCGAGGLAGAQMPRRRPRRCAVRQKWPALFHGGQSFGRHAARLFRSLLHRRILKNVPLSAVRSENSSIPSSPARHSHEDPAAAFRHHRGRPARGSGHADCSRGGALPHWIASGHAVTNDRLSRATRWPACLEQESPDLVFNLVEGVDGKGHISASAAPRLLAGMGMNFTGAGAEAMEHDHRQAPHKNNTSRRPGLPTPDWSAPPDWPRPR